MNENRLIDDSTLHMLRAWGRNISQPQQHALNSVKLMKKLKQLDYQVPCPDLYIQKHAQQLQTHTDLHSSLTWLWQGSGYCLQYLLH